MEWWILPSIDDVQESLKRHYEAHEVDDLDLVMDFYEEINYERLTRSVDQHLFKSREEELYYAKVVMDEMIDAIVEERKKEEALDQ